VDGFRFIMRSFAVFDKVNVGGTEEDFHDIFPCLSEIVSRVILQ
jgi:hypothetical protein